MAGWRGIAGVDNGVLSSLVLSISLAFWSTHTDSPSERKRMRQLCNVPQCYIVAIIKASTALGTKFRAQIIKILGIVHPRC